MTNAEIQKCKETAKAGKVPTLVKLTNDLIYQRVVLTLANAEGNIKGEQEAKAKVESLIATIAKVRAMTAEEFKSFNN